MIYAFLQVHPTALHSYNEVYFSAIDSAVKLLSCPAKKVTKECGIGKALSIALPRAKDALPYVPIPSRTYDSSGAP